MMSVEIEGDVGNMRIEMAKKIYGERIDASKEARMLLYRLPASDIEHGRS
jgi:hypothetical protein